MTMRLLILSLALLLSVNAISAELTVTLKPAKGIKGTHSIRFQDDGRVSLLVYQSATHIVDNAVAIEPAEAARLRHLATRALDQYLTTQDFSALKRHTLLIGIARTQDEVIQSVSSRRLSESAIALIDALGRYVPQPLRVKLER